MNLENAIIIHLVDTTSLLKTQGADDFIVIGGIALRCHMNQQSKEPIFSTSDADVMCGYTSYSILRDLYKIKSNLRLMKHEYKVESELGGEKINFDVDLYLDQQHSLSINFNDINATRSSNPEGSINTASIANLLRLKADNYSGYDGNTGCDKHQKIMHDIVQLIGLMHVAHVEKQQIINAIDESCLDTLRSLVAENKEIVESVNTHLGIECVNEWITDCIEILREDEQLKMSS